MVNLNLLGAFTILGALITATPSYGAIKEYHLKTKVISGDKTKDDLYVTGYHTGAGYGDIALTSNATYASKGFLNGTYQQFDYNTSFPWGLYLRYPTYYTQWLTAEIDVGYGDAGFSFDSSGLISSNPEWAGWIACDWWHGVPQLFWQYYFKDITLPCSCAKVGIHKKDI